MEDIRAERRLMLGWDRPITGPMQLPSTSPEDKRRRWLDGGLVIVGHHTLKVRAELAKVRLAPDDDDVRLAGLVEALLALEQCVHDQRDVFEVLDGGTRSIGTDMRDCVRACSVKQCIQQAVVAGLFSI